MENAKKTTNDNTKAPAPNHTFEKEKARQGGWNGGFAPYGYYLKDKQLLIQEEEAEAIRTIFDKFVNGNMGFSKIAKYIKRNTFLQMVLL